MIYYRPQTKFTKVMFLHLSVGHSVHKGVSRPRPGGEVGGSAWGVSRPRPRGEVGESAWGCPGPGWGVSRPRLGGPDPDPGCPGLGRCVSQHGLRQTPPSRWLLLRTVCILLECILVDMRLHHMISQGIVHPASNIHGNSNHNVFVHIALADPGGGVLSLSVQFFKISCIFWEIIAKIIGWRLLFGVGKRFRLRNPGYLKD